MNFANVSVENKQTPLALQELDDSLGAHTQEAYIAATQGAPELNGLPVILDEKAGHFKPSELGLSGSYVSINPDPKHYKYAIKTGIVGQRMGEYSQLYRSKGITPSVNELIVAVLLHEMGHAKDLSGYITQASGDTKVAFDLSKKVRDSQLAGLPLKAATSRAVWAWENNVDGYRDQLRSVGVSDENWHLMVAQNTFEYGALECEKVADRFALGVLATLNT